MISASGKYSALLLICAILLGCLGACRKNEETPADTSEPPVITSEAPSADVTETPAITADNKADETPDNAVTPPGDTRAAASAAAALVLSDTWAIDFIINLTMNGIPIYDDIEPDLSDYPVTAQEYMEYSSLIAALEKIYSSEKVYTPFFRYPIFGYPQMFVRDDGLNYVYPHYPSGFESRIDVDSIKITELSAESAVFSFDIFDHEFFTNGSMSMTLTPDGWKLDESFYFYCLKRLNLMNTVSATAWENNPLLDPDQNAGSAKRLTGECMFYNIFINDAESSWDEQSIADYYELQGTVFRYLEEQASMFGHELRFFATDAEHALFFDVSDVVSGDPNGHFWFDRYLTETTYGDVNGLLDALKIWADDPDYNNYGLMINLNKQGRSYAIPHNTEYHSNGAYYAERMVVYYSPDNYPGYAMVGDISARILWLYGALNMNYPYDGDVVRKEIILRYFPFEIMHNIPYLADVATISAFTAFRVGWRDTLPEQLMMFQAKG